MDKPNDHSTLSYMRTYIKNKKLNDKPIKLNMKRAETIKHLRKLDHWDSSVDGQKKPKAGKDVKGTSKKRVTIGKEDVAKKRLDEYVKLHVKYIDTFDDKGLSNFSTFESAKKESDKQLDKMADLVEPISQILIRDYIKKTKGVSKARAQVKELSESLEERFDKLPKKKKPAKPKGKNISVKVLAIEDKTNTAEKPKVKVSERKILASNYFKKYNKTIYQILKPFNTNMSSESKAKQLSKDEIKKTAKQIRIKLHPDKGGDPEEFAKANEAIQILLDTIK